MNESRISCSALIGLFIILGGLAISIFLSSSSLPLWSNIFAYFLLVIMFIIIVYISPIWEKFLKYLDKRRRNNLAKKFFLEFKQENFVGKFERIQSNDYDYAFHNIIEKLKNIHQEFKPLPEPKIELINNSFTFWLRWYGYFDGKIDFDSFSTMLDEFGSMVRGYHRICIKEPLKEISRINETNEIKISRKIKDKWEIAAKHYDDFEKRYNHFLDKVNGEFKEPFLSGLPPAKEL